MEHWFCVVFVVGGVLYILHGFPLAFYGVIYLIVGIAFGVEWQSIKRGGYQPIKQNRDGILSPPKRSGVRKT